MALKFYSKYSECEIITPKYLVEMVCEHRANKNKEILPKKFWQHAKWKKVYISQIQMAYGLLNIYEESLLVKLVREYKILTLNSKFLQDKLDIESPKCKPVTITESQTIDPNLHTTRPLKINDSRKKLDEI